MTVSVTPPERVQRVDEMSGADPMEGFSNGWGSSLRRTQKNRKTNPAAGNWLVLVIVRFELSYRVQAGSSALVVDSAVDWREAG